MKVMFYGCITLENGFDAINLFSGRSGSLVALLRKMNNINKPTGIVHLFIQRFDKNGCETILDT